MDIHQAFQEFGISVEEEQVYTALTEGNWVTTLELSRLTKFNRTSLYRLLESLIQKGLVDKRLGDKTSYYQAASPENFQSLILEKEESLNKMREAAQAISATVATIKSHHPPNKTIVNFYNSIRSLKNQEWKLSRTKDTEMLVFGANEWHIHMGEKFAEEVRERYVQNNTHIKELLSLDQKENVPSHNNPEWTKNRAYLKIYEQRFIDPKLLNIQDEIIVIKDSIVFYGLSNKETVGIEIISPVYANMLRQLFHIAWDQAEK